jgi:RimJ/RimL family protein N-acetyltransferase
MRPDLIETKRLRLHVFTPEFLRAALDGERARAEVLLGVALPADWPDPDDVHVLRMRLSQLDADPGCGPWLTRGIELAGERRLIGIGGFHAPPGGSWLAEVAPGGVEFGYTIYEPWRRQGFAFEASQGLIEWAAARGVTTFVLSISPKNRASRGLARKLGFAKVASWHHELRGLEHVYRLTLGGAAQRAPSSALRSK